MATFSAIYANANFYGPNPLVELTAANDLGKKWVLRKTWIKF